MMPWENIQKFTFCCFCGWHICHCSKGKRTNGDFLIGHTCYFCWGLGHTCACAHTKTHNLKNVSRRFECQGFPPCWPAVSAAAGPGCVAVCKETQRTTWQVLFTDEEKTVCLCHVLQPNAWCDTWYLQELSLESIHSNRKRVWINPSIQWFSFAKG